MDKFLEVQRWLYGGMARDLGHVAGGEFSTLVPALVLAIAFGAVHALMPGHGKMVLLSYYLGQPSKVREGFVAGVILALTHVGTAVLLVLAGVAVISRAFAAGGRTPAFVTASSAMIALVGVFLLWRALGSRHQLHGRDGKALAVVTGLIPCPLTTFILGYALARGMLAAGLAVTGAMAAGMIVTIAGVAVAGVLARDRLMAVLARTEWWRHRLGKALEIGSSVAVLGLGILSFFRSL